VKNQSLVGISVYTIHMSEEGIKTTIKEAGVRIKLSTLEVTIDPLYREETIEILKEKYDVDDAKELLDTIYSYLLIVSTILGVFALVALTVSSIMIYITTHINVVERTKEIGILKSLGFVKSEILFLFLIESVLTGLISSIICITLTELISLLINQITQDLFTFSFVVVEMKAIISIVLLGVTLSSLSGFKPALNASRKDAVEALRFE
jgi:putative ABC transport system permease protein